MHTNHDTDLLTEWELESLLRFPDEYENEQIHPVFEEQNQPVSEEFPW